MIKLVTPQLLSLSTDAATPRLRLMTARDIWGMKSPLPRMTLDDLRRGAMSGEVQLICDGVSAELLDELDGDKV